MRPRACGVCHFWQRYAGYDTTTGECRRHPPVVVATSDTVFSDRQWPATNNTDWCGEFSHIDSHT